MKYSVEGKDNKTLLIFITGACVSKWMWKYQKTLSNQYKCIYFDLPGHGENSDIRFTTIDDVCISIIDIIKRESLDGKAIIVGHSIGAQIVLKMLESYDKHVFKAIAISGLNFPMKRLMLFIKPMLSISMPLIKMKWFAKLQSKAFYLPSELFEQYYLDSLKISFETLINIMKENMSFDFNTIVRGIPTIILNGEKEIGIMRKSAIKSHKNIKGSKYFVLKNAAHGIPYEKSDLLNSIITNFIENKKQEFNDIVDNDTLSANSN
ncbi:MAG: alpha/beta hydrolase [Bacteroidia bacterium]|nr:alpha/beta hydrolase [Bacteroidia bacterium]